MTGWGVDEGHVVVGRRIRQARQELGLTQAELATRIGVSLEVLDGLETGRADPSAKLAQIAEATGRPVSWYTTPSQYDVVGAVYETGLPAELRRRLAESSGRPPWADTGLVEQGGQPALAEPDPREANGGPSTRGDDHSDPAGRSEDLAEVRDAPAHEQAHLAQRVSQLEAELRAAEERVAEATARRDRAETELESARTRERSLAEELDLRKARLSLWAAELDKREAAIAEAEAKVENRRRILGGVDRHAPTHEPREEDSRVRNDELEHGAGVRNGLARRVRTFKRKARVVEDGRPVPEDTHLAVAPDHGYRLVEREGAAPDPGAIVELDGVHLRCLRIQASPFLGDDRSCAVLELLPPSRAPERSGAPE